MNRFNFNSRIIPLLFGLSLFFAQADDNDHLKKQPNVKTVQPEGKKQRTTKSTSAGRFIPTTDNTVEKTPIFIDQEPLPLSYEPYKQPADGIKFAKEKSQRTAQKNNVHIKTGIVSSKTILNEDVDENLIETILNRHSSGLPLNIAETEILKANINGLAVENTPDTRRPSISKRHRASRDASDLFFSEYAEGSSTNKYIEIYNGTGADVDLSNYLITQITNGGNWYENIDTLSGTLVHGDVYVIAHTSADASILAEADLTESVITNFNGDDARGLIKVVDGDTTVLDYIGSAPEDPGNGWAVAGITNATKDHTLVRKSTITGGSTSWTTSAGTNTTDSEWIVHDQDTWSYLGSHTMIEPNLLSEGFEGGVMPDDWTVINNDDNNNSWIVYGSAFYAHSGDYSMRVTYGNQSSDDWLITPKLDVASGDSVAFWAKSDNNASPEAFNIKVSTTANEDVAAFATTLASVTSVPGSWTRYAFALESYADQNIYVAVQCVSDNGQRFWADDFSGPQVWIDDSPVAAVSTSSIDFGNTGTGGMSAPIVISNYGASDLVISSIAVSNTDFSPSVPTVTLTGGGGDTEVITVTYTPTAFDGDTSFVVLTHNGSSSPDSIQVMGAGKDAIYWQDFESWGAELLTAEPQPIGMTQEGNMSRSGDGTANGWEKTAESAAVFTGTYAAEFDSYEGIYTGTDTSAFILPAIEYTSTSIAAVEGALRFYMKKRGTEEFYVAYSNDSGATWIKEYSDTTEHYGSGTTGWINVSVEVPLGGTYIFKLVGRANQQSVLGDVFIDEITFEEVPPTPELSLTYSTVGFIPQVIGNSTTSIAFTVGLNYGSAALVVDSIVTDNEDLSVDLTTMSTNNSVAPGGNVDLDLAWAPTSFGLTKTSAVIFHNADTSPDTIVFAGEAGRSYVSFDENDDFQGSAFDGSLPWSWVNTDADGDGDSWLFNYSYYGPGYTGDPIGYYARSLGGGNRLQSRAILPVAGDSLIFYYNSSSSSDSSSLYIKAKKVGDQQLDYITTDTLQFDGYTNMRAAIDLSSHVGDTIKIRVVDDVMENDYSYHRLDDLLLPAYQISSTGQLVFGEEMIDFGLVHPDTSASITIVVSNMGAADLTISSVVSNNATFSPVLANSTLLAETTTELTVTFAPMDGAVQSGNIVVAHDAPSSPDTLELFSGGMAYVAGVVTNNETGEALDSVTVDAGGYITNTNGVGEYGYYSAPTGLTLVQFMKDGYNNASFWTTLSGGDTITLNAALEPLGINAMYFSGLESGEDLGSSNAITGATAYAVADTFVNASGDTILPAAGTAMLVFPDSGGYANNDIIWWTADSAFDIGGLMGGLYMDLDINIDTEADHDLFYFCLLLDNGTAWYDSENGFVSGSTDGWTQHHIDMSWALDMGSETATPVIVFVADGDSTVSGGVFDNISITWNPFFLAPPSHLSVVNYGSSLPLSWEEPARSGRASYNVGSIDLSAAQPPQRPMVLDDNGIMVEQLKGPRDFPIVTAYHDYNASSSRSLLGYNVYRAVWPFGDFQLLAYETSTAYEDVSVSEGTYYSYTVSAVYDEGETGGPGTVNARAGLPVVVTDEAYGGEDFEADDFSWENWEAFYSSDAAMWVVGDSAAADSAFGLGGMPPPSHSNFAFITDGRGSGNDFTTFLLSPFFDFIDNFTAIVGLSGYAQVYGDFAYNNTAQLLVRSDMGPWEVAIDFGYDHLDGWGNYSATIGDIVSGRDKAQLALLYTHTGGLSSGNGNGVAFDDLIFETIPGPHNLVLTPTTTDITLNWSHPDSTSFAATRDPQPALSSTSAMDTDGIIDFSSSRDLSCFNPNNMLYYWWGMGEGNGIWSVTEFDVDTVPLLSVTVDFRNTPFTINSNLEAEVLIAAADTLDSLVALMDTIFHSYETIPTGAAEGNEAFTVTLSDTFYNAPGKVVFVMIRGLTPAVWEINGVDTTYLFAPFFRSDDGASWSGMSGQVDSLGGIYVIGGDGFGLPDWVDFSIELCADVPPPDMAYNVYKDHNLLAENLETTTLVDNNVSVTTESCYWVHGVVPKTFNTGITMLNVLHETDQSNTACGILINSPPGNFSLTTPPDERVVVIRPENIDQSQLFAWSVSVDPNGQPVHYTITLNATISGSVVTIEQDTSARVIMLPYSEVYDLLSEHSVQDFSVFQWTVSSSDGQLSTTAINGPRTVTFDIGYMLNNDSEALLPDVFALHQNYPNPFNPVTTIRFDVPEESRVRIDIYNVMGQKVAAVVDAHYQPGFHAVNWGGMNTSGSALSSGMYFYRIQADNFTAVKKLILVK